MSARKEVIEDIPSKIDTNTTLRIVKSGQGTKKYFGMLKTLTNEDDTEIADWLNISVKTFRLHKNSQKPTKSALTEHVIMLISLFKHGKNIFGSAQVFKEWLEKANFFFDSKAPIAFIDTISGIKFIDDRLTAIEYGDNA